MPSMHTRAVAIMEVAADDRITVGCEDAEPLSTYAVLVHLILAQPDSETRGESADDSTLYGCPDLTCKRERTWSWSW